MNSERPGLTTARTEAVSWAVRNATQYGLNLGDQWAIDSAQDMAGLFGNQAFMKLAAVMAASNPKAADYIRQAPVLVLAIMGNQKHLNIRKRLFAISQFGTVCGTGQKLASLMRMYKLPVQLRQLKAGALAPIHFGAVMHLARIDPSTLAQIIPDKYQARWLRACNLWIEKYQQLGGQGRNRVGMRVWGCIPHLDWLGRHWFDVTAHRNHAPGPAGDMADFFIARPQNINPKWTWQQAAAARDRWHIDLAKMKVGDAKVSTEPFPRQMQVGMGGAGVGFEFVALNSALELVIEGQQLRHCVASYFEPLAAGVSRIVSCRTAGELIATAEFRLNTTRYYDPATMQQREEGLWRPVQFKAYCNTQAPKEARDALMLYTALINRSLTPDKR